MNWWNDLRVFLAGKKTILTAIAYGVDAAGAQMGWWQPDELRTTAEEVMGVIFLRQGMRAAKALAPAGQQVTAEAVK